MLELSSFMEVALRYKVIFFDSYGVLRNYKGVFSGASDMLKTLNSYGITYYILTNDASRSPQQLADKFHQQDVFEITSKKIISSGMLARDYLESKVRTGTVVYLGTENSAHYIETAGLKTVAIRDVDLDATTNYTALVLLDDEGFDWNTDITKTLNLLRKQNMPVIVANTDVTYPVAKHDVNVAIGAIGDMLEVLARKTFIRFGKPDSQMFSYAYNQALRKVKITKRDVLMVGDTLKTDIIGGNKFGVDTCLVLSGNIQPQNAELLINSTGIIPDFICDSVMT
jgi:HAD superfamily hydrolase (TIGR01450 family)